MVNYQQVFKLFPLLSLWVICLAQEEHQAEALHRNKRTLTTICVEIKPSGPQEEPYFMCKGTDISRGGGNASPPPPSPPHPAAAIAPPPSVPEQQQQQQQQPMQNYAPPAGQMIPVSVQYAQTPFPSFPSFGAGFFPILPSYEESPSKPEAPPSQTSYQSQAPAPAGGSESTATNYGSAAAPFAPAPPAQSYGMPAVPYSATGGTPPANRGIAAGPGATATPTSYADAASAKSSPNAHKSQPGSSHANSYDALVGSRHRMPPSEDVMNMPNVGFRYEELRRPMEPMVGVGPPPGMMWTPLAQAQFQQPTLPPYHDDPVMRTFYASQQEQYEPQVAQAAPTEQLVGQAAPGYASAYANAPQQQSVAPPQAPPPPQQQAPPIYAENPKYNPAQSPSADSCASCNRPCTTPLETYNGPPAHCPSFQPVIIAMPCYGQQQQPTHYLAVPGSGAQAPQREQMLGNAFGGPFGMAGPGMGSPFGMNSQFGMAAPQVGSNYNMGPQVGAPFGLAPVLNPFGPFGHLNPFNPFNRILGAAAAAPTTQQPRLRLFGAPQEATTPTIGTATSPAISLFPKAFTLNFASSTVAPPAQPSTESSDVSLGASRTPDAEQKPNDNDDTDDDDNDDDADGDGDGEEKEQEEDELGSQQVSVSPQSAESTDNVSSSRDPDVLEAQAKKKLSAGQLLDKGLDKLSKADKRKRHNSRNNNATQKRKYLQRL